MKTQKQLAKNVIGQLEGVIRMMEEKEDCFKIIIQMKAAHSALGSLMEKFIRENFLRCSSCVKNTKEKERLQKLLSLLIK